MRVALVGGGVIGGGWAGRLVENGLDVVLFDPHPDAQRRVREVLDNAERAWAHLTYAPRARGTVTFATELDEAVRDADLVQESVPENVELKRRLFAEIEKHAPADALIASSTSGLLPSVLQADLRRPERLLVAHPFNPVYLLPLVEIVGGEHTSEESLSGAIAFYESIGMRPLRVRSEIDGFVADRLLEALWREALWLVEDGVATVEEIDDAVRFGPGLRWAQMGTFLTYRIAGGEEGMHHFLEQFGPALQWPWTKLMDVPELDAELIDRIARQSDDQAGGLSVRELERLRDDNLVAILQALRARRYAAGEVLHEHEKRLYEQGVGGAGEPDPSEPLRLHETTVDPASVDYNGHMTESRYGVEFGHGTDAFLRHVGLDAAYLERGRSAYTVEGHIRFLREASALEPIAVDTQVLAADEKRLHLFHSLRHGRSGELLATGEYMLLHVDTGEGRTCPWEQPVAARVAAAAAAHAVLPVPDGAGRAVSMPRAG
jgi:carnitine 3-dehydrogenase / betainyl-CoA thioesterase